MPTTDKELAEKRERVQKLREQVAAEEAKRVERERGQVNDVEAERLDAEAARLQRELDAAKSANQAAVAAPPTTAPKAADKNKEG